MRRSGVAVTLVTAERWNEGGSIVEADPAEDGFVVTCRTWGRHPALFLYDPRPIWRLLRQQRPHILDVHEEPYSLAAAEVNLLRRLVCPSAKLMLYSAQNIAKHYPLPIRLLERAALRAASAVYVCNRRAAEILHMKGFAGTAVLLPLGLDLARFSSTQRRRALDVGARQCPRGLTIGYVGRLEERKGLQTILEAMVPALDWWLYVAGDGPDRRAFARRAEELGVSQRVRWHGFVDNDELPAIFQSLDVLVVPSIPTPRWDEQFCRVAVEAMAAGTPVVASRTGALPEVVGDAGVLVEPGDAAGLRKVLERLEHDDGLRRELSRRGVQRARSFSWDAVAAEHTALYEVVMQS